MVALLFPFLILASALLLFTSKKKKTVTTTSSSAGTEIYGPPEPSNLGTGAAVTGDFVGPISLYDRTQKKNSVLYFKPLFVHVGAQFNVPWFVLAAMAMRESGGDSINLNPNAKAMDTNGRWSYGLMQVQFETAQQPGKYTGTRDGLLDPFTNVYYAAKYVRYQMDRYDGHDYPFLTGVAAYNAGRRCTVKSSPLVFCNQGYVDKIKNNMGKLVSSAVLQNSGVLMA